MLLPLRPEPKLEPKPDTTYPRLPFTREIDLEEEVVKLLSAECDGYSIPAIKHVRETMNWGLIEAKDYVDKILEKHLDKIKAARVECLERLKKHDNS